MTFTFQPVFWGTLLGAWILACLKTHRGPLVLLGIAVTHVRAALLTLRWLTARVPGDLRRVYPQAVENIRRQG